MLAGINFLDATSFDDVHLHSGELQAGAAAFIPSGSKGATPFFGNQKKSRICEEKYFETRLKRKSFYMEQCCGEHTDETRIAAEPKDWRAGFSEVKQKQDGWF